MRRIITAFFLVVALAFSTPAFANACAWVSGSTANWSSAAAWTSCGGVAPTAADTVTVSGTGTLTIDGTSGSPNLARSVDFTGFTGTLTHAASKELDIGNASGGSLTLVSGMTYSPNSTALIKFVSTTTGNTIAWGGKSPTLITFDGVGGGWQFSDAPGSSASTTFTLTNGALDVNGKAVTASFSSNNSNTRSLTLGASTWTVGAGGSWDITTSTGMTLSAASSTITTLSSSQVFTFNGGGLTYGTLSDTSLTTGNPTITGANTFGTLTLSNGAGNSGSYQLGANQTVTGTFTANGNSVNNRDFIRSTVKGTPRTITAATVVASNLDLQDIVGAGAGSWNLSAITGLSGDCGGNSGITFTTPISTYWTGHTGNWSLNTNWKTTSGGATTARTPLCQDTAVFDANSFNAGSQTATFDTSASPRTGPINFTGVTNAPTFAIGTVSLSDFGSLTYGSGMSVSGSGTITFEGRSGGTITTASVTTPFQFAFNSASGVYQLGDNLTLSGANSLLISSGTLQTNGHSLTQSSASSSMTVSGTLTIDSTATLGATGGNPIAVSATGTLNINAGAAISYSFANNPFTSATNGIIQSNGILTWNGQTKTISATSAGGGSGGSWTVGG